MHILITGDAGFIGFHLTKKCLSLKIPVIGFDNINNYYDKNLKKARRNELHKYAKKHSTFYEPITNELENIESLREIFDKYNPKRVIHLAAQAGVRYSIQNPSAYIQSNIVGFSNLIELCRNYKVSNFIYASSSSVYGGNTNMPFQETKGVDHPVSLMLQAKEQMS